MLSHLNLLYLNKNNYSPDKIAIHIAVFKVIISLKTNITQRIYHHLSVKHEFTSQYYLSSHHMCPMGEIRDTSSHPHT